MPDPYLQDDCKVLKNKLGIKSETELDKAEIDYSLLALKKISQKPIKGNYDFSHYCEFHKMIFGDVYEWAGTPRTIHIEKAEPKLAGMTIEYAEPDEIKKTAKSILKTMNSRDWSAMSLEDKTKYLSEDMAALWKVHPFREGNTRTTVNFVCQFIESKGVPIDRTLFAKNAEYMRNALVFANATYADANFKDDSYLKRIVKDGLERGEREQAYNNLRDYADKYGTPLDLIDKGIEFGD